MLRNRSYIIAVMHPSMLGLFLKSDRAVCIEYNYVIHSLRGVYSCHETNAEIKNVTEHNKVLFGKNSHNVNTISKTGIV
jgi:hypothetical protein